MTVDSIISARMREWFEGAEGTRAFHALCRIAEQSGHGTYELQLRNLETGETVQCAIVVPAETGKAEVIFSPAAKALR